MDSLGMPSFSPLAPMGRGCMASVKMDFWVRKLRSDLVSVY